MKQLVFVILGHICLLLGGVALLLPIIPTSPFLIVAAFFYSRGSETFHRWLLLNPHFGPTIRDWETHGVVRPRAKVGGTLVILISFLAPLFLFDFPLPVDIAIGGVAVLLLVGLVTRPSRPPEEAPPTEQ